MLMVFSTDGLSFEFAASSMTGASPQEYRQMMIGGGRSIEGNRRVGEKQSGPNQVRERK